MLGKDSFVYIQKKTYKCNFNIAVYFNGSICFFIHSIFAERPGQIIDCSRRI